jgi:DNA-binding MarR family transcriptional regulator
MKDADMVVKSIEWKKLAEKFCEQNKEFRIRAFRNILELSHLTEKFLDFRLSSNDGVNHTQRIIILLILEKGQSMTPTELSKITLRSVDTLNKSIDGLNKMGLTRSYQSRKDRRIRKVLLTEKGLEFAEKSLPIRYVEFTKAMSCFSDKEVEIFEQLSTRMIENMVRIVSEEINNKK